MGIAKMFKFPPRHQKQADLAEPRPVRNALDAALDLASKYGAVSVYFSPHSNEWEFAISFEVGASRVRSAITLERGGVSKLQALMSCIEEAKRRGAAQ